MSLQDEAIEALIERRIRERLADYNAKIANALHEAEHDPKQSFKRYPLRDWFWSHVKEDE